MWKHRCPRDLRSIVANPWKTPCDVGTRELRNTRDAPSTQDGWFCLGHLYSSVSVIPPIFALDLDFVVLVLVLVDGGGGDVAFSIFVSKHGLVVSFWNSTT